MYFKLYFSGVTLISMALCSDAVIGNVQEKAMRQHSASNSEVVGSLQYDREILRKIYVPSNLKWYKMHPDVWDLYARIFFRLSV